MDVPDSLDRQGPQFPIDSVTLRKLCSLLKNKGDIILNGEALFTLTTNVLNRLNVDCRRHSLSQSEEDESRSDVADGTNSWRPLRKFLKKSDHRKEQEREEWKSNIQFVKDFMLSTPRLKVIHKHGTLSFPISLSRFQNLSSLEIRKVPAHLVEGLQGLRGSLEALTVIRSFSNVKDLLERCGGDRSVPLTWTKLKVLSLVFNDLRDLDDSLSLVSQLERLNLSHNCINTTDKFLENLVEVVLVTLAYNQLTVVPSFSPTSRISLTTLILRGNQLNNIQGMEVLSSLQVLDVGENHLVDHLALSPLQALARLTQLSLDRNPLAYHRNYRRLTVCHLSTRAVCVQFVLDNKRLSGSEVMAYNPQVALRNSARTWMVPDSRQDRSSAPSSPLLPNHRRPKSESSGIGTADNSPELTSTPKKNGKRKRLKARQTEIRDLDESGEVSSSMDVTSPGGSPCVVRNLEKQFRDKREEALRTQREVEKLRLDLGPNWLQAIQDRNIFNQTKTTESGPSSKTNSPSKGSMGKRSSPLEEDKGADIADANIVEGDAAEKSDTSGPEMGKPGESSDIVRSDEVNPTEDDLYLKDTTVDPVNNPIMAAIAKLAGGQSENEAEGGDEGERFKESKLQTSSETKTSVGVDSISGGDGGVGGNRRGEAANLATKEDQQSPEKASLAREDIAGEEVVSSSEDKTSKVEAAPSLSGVKDSPLCREPRPKDRTTASSGQRAATSPESSVRLEGSQVNVVHDRSTDKSTSEVDTSTDNSLQILENENESEPMFVTLPDANGAMVIVTLTDLFIVEKDVRGRVTEKLDLRSLVTITTKKANKKVRSSEAGKQDEGVRLVLKFSYLRKDRKRRCYLMDPHDSKVLCAHVQPHLDARAEEARKKDAVIMQCLKCNRSFQKKDVVRRKQTLPTSGSSKDLKVLQELMDTVTLVCPRCGSTMLIELESSDIAKTSGAGSSTSYGSQSSSSSFMDSWHQQQQQQHQQQQQQALPRKPAPMLRNKSFDYQSPQATLAARIARNRKSSTDSLPSNRKGHVISESSSQFNPPASTTSVTEGRERSNAILDRKLLKQNTPLVTGKTEILPIEDHFSTQLRTASKQLAEMTESLRSETPAPETRGYDVPRTTSQSEKSSTVARDDVMSDSGFESGVYSSGLPGQTQTQQTKQPTGSYQTVKIDSRGDGKGEGKMEERNTEEIGREKEEENRKKKCEEKEKVNQDRKKGDRQDDEVKEKEYQGARNKEEEKKKKKGLGKAPSKHKNLAAMADLVNSLVTEGQDLEEKEMQKKAETESIHSLYTDEEEKKSISVSELKRFFPVVSAVSTQQRSCRGSVDSDILPLNRSVSGSSITVLHNLDVSHDDNGDASKDNEDGMRVAAQFVVGSWTEEASSVPTSQGHQIDSHIVAGMSSPLSSSICNSMVSSVYENVVPESTDPCDNSASSGQKTLLAPRSSVDSVGSEIVRVDEDEDMSSIYDRPRRPRSAVKKTELSQWPGGVDRPSRDEQGETTTGGKEGIRASPSYSDMLDRISMGGNYQPPVYGSVPSLTDHVDHGHRAMFEQSFESTGAVASGGEHSYEDAAGGDEGDGEEEENFLDGGYAGSEVTYRFDRLDHRLTLYLMMTLFENHEEFVCKMSCECVGYSVEESYPALFIMSSSRFYILKVAPHGPTEEPNKWLSFVEVQPIPELRFIDMGLGGQSLRLEFVTDCSSYTLITRNRTKTIQFMEVLHNQLAHYAVSQGIASKVVVNEDVDQTTLDNLDSDILNKVVPGQTLLLYVMGFIDRGFHKRFPVSFVVSTKEICLVRADHQWPQPRLQPPLNREQVGKQFTVLERHNINNIASLEVCELTLRCIRLDLFNETDGASSSWNICLASKQGTFDLIQAVSEPWSREFGVDMDVAYSVLDFGNKG